MPHEAIRCLNEEVDFSFVQKLFEAWDTNSA